MADDETRADRALVRIVAALTRERDAVQALLAEKDAEIERLHHKVQRARGVERDAALITARARWEEQLQGPEAVEADERTAASGKFGFLRDLGHGWIADLLAEKDAEIERLQESRDNWKQGYEAQEAARARWEEQQEGWLNAWVDRHDAGDMTDDDTLAVFAFIAELRDYLAAAAKAATDAR